MVKFFAAAFLIITKFAALSDSLSGFRNSLLSYMSRGFCLMFLPNPTHRYINLS